jgi:hypothetical protein
MDCAFSDPAGGRECLCDSVFQLVEGQAVDARKDERPQVRVRVDARRPSWAMSAAVLAWHGQVCNRRLKRTFNRPFKPRCGFHLDKRQSVVCPLL